MENTSGRSEVPTGGEPSRSQTDGDLQQVEVERLETGEAPAGGAGSAFPGYVHMSFSSRGGPLQRPPVLATWICLALAWLFLGSKLPFTVFIGLPLNCLALLLAVVSLARGAVGTGMLVLLLGTAGSIVVYIVGLFRFLALGL